MGKNIRRVILFEWVILFKKPTVMALIGNFIHRVNVIKGSTILPSLQYEDGEGAICVHIYLEI